MEPWGVEVKSGETQKVKPEFGKLIHISQAMIHISEDEPKNYRGPRLKIDDKYFTIGKKSTQIGLRLVLQKEFELSHNNKNGSVYFLGHIADDPVSGLDKSNSEIAKTTEKLDEDDYNAFDDQREDVLSVNTKAVAMKPNKDRFLYIFLGFDNLLSVNFDELCRSGNSCSEPILDLKFLFSPRTNGTTGSLLPLGMGLFFSDSKLHFFGGENLEYREFSSTPSPRDRLSIHIECIGLPINVRPKYGKKWYDGKYYSYIECDEEWLNKNVFSFDLPHFTRVNSTLIPSHSSCKFRPFVFTISKKTYALSGGPISLTLATFKHDKHKLKYFEVYDHVKKEWRDLENPPKGLREQIERQTFRINGCCVFKEKMLLRTYRAGDYLFDSVSGKWEKVVDKSYPDILAGIVISDEHLLVLCGEYKSFADAMLPFKLVVYNLNSFGKGNKIAAELNIYKNVIDLNHISIVGASFHLLDDNHINLVLVSQTKIHVLVLKVEMFFEYAVVKLHKEFDKPLEICCFNDRLHSTFIF